jgi:hypothetical protein
MTQKSDNAIIVWCISSVLQDIKLCNFLQGTRYLAVVAEFQKVRGSTIVWLSSELHVVHFEAALIRSI